MTKHDHTLRDMIHESVPAVGGNLRFAVKIVNDFGIESLKVIDLD